MRSSPLQLQALLADRDNNFDVLRLVAATVVLVFHAYLLTGYSQPVLPSTELPVSDVGLLIFFAISGFLVARSWLHEPRVLPFAIKRGLRILPGLVVALVISAYVIGALSATTGPVDHLTAGTPAKYVAGHSLLLSERGLHGRVAAHVVDSPDESLPGVFAENPSRLLNGPLWTLPVEVGAYTLLVLGGLLALFWGRWSTRLAAGAVFIGASGLALRAGGLDTYSLYSVFAGGALLYALRDRLSLNFGLFALAVGVWVASYQLPDAGQAIVTGLTVPYAVVFLAFRGLNGLRWLTRPGDLSYGMYIYAWPVGQLVVQATGTRSPAVVMVLSLVLTYALAFLSWRVIERPALRLKGRLTRPSVDRTSAGAEADLAPVEVPGRVLTATES